MGSRQERGRERERGEREWAEWGRSGGRGVATGLGSRRQVLAAVKHSAHSTWTAAVVVGGERDGRGGNWHTMENCRAALNRQQQQAEAAGSRQ